MKNRKFREGKHGEKEKSDARRLLVDRADRVHKVVRLLGVSAHYLGYDNFTVSRKVALWGQIDPKSLEEKKHSANSKAKTVGKFGRMGSQGSLSRAFSRQASVQSNTSNRRVVKLSSMDDLTKKLQSHAQEKERVRQASITLEEDFMAEAALMSPATTPKAGGGGRGAR